MEGFRTTEIDVRVGDSLALASRLWQDRRAGMELDAAGVPQGAASFSITGSIMA